MPAMTGKAMGRLSPRKFLRFVLIVLSLCLLSTASGCGSDGAAGGSEVSEAYADAGEDGGAGGESGIAEGADGTDGNASDVSDVSDASDDNASDVSGEGDGVGTDASSGLRHTPPGGLSVIGQNLCDDKGNPIQLRGMSTHGIQWFPEYVNQDLFTELHDVWNCNVVRLAMYTAEWQGYCQDGDRNALKDTIDRGVSYATNADMYVIIDWHILRDSDPMTYKDDAVDFFREMSAKYADNPHVIYEICNEPNGSVTWARIREYAMEVIPVIRENSPDSVIIVGTPMYSGAIKEPLKDPIIEYDNIMYSLHFYARSHRESRIAEMNEAYNQGLPIFVTEFGATANSGSGDIDAEFADIWLDELDLLNISYICWNLSNKDEGSAIIKSDCDKTSGLGYDDLKDQGVWFMGRLE